MAGARAVVAQGRLAGHHYHHPLEEEKLVAGAEVVTGIAGSEERLEVAEMVGVDHDHHPLEEEKLDAGAGAEGCVEGLATFFADLPCRQLKKPHSRPLLAEFSPAGDAVLQHVAEVEEPVVLLPLWLLHDQHHTRSGPTR